MTFTRRCHPFIMRKAFVLILVLLFVLGALALGGCKKKEAPTAETALTAEITPTAVPTLAPTMAPTVAPTGMTATPTAEKGTAEKRPGK